MFNCLISQTAPVGNVGLAGVCGDAAVGSDDRAGHIGGIIGGEKGDYAGHFRRLTHASKRDGTKPGFAVFGPCHGKLSHRGFDQSGA